MRFQIRKYSFVLIVVLCMIYLYQKRKILLSVGSVLLYASVFSMILSPICKKLEERGLRESFSAFLSVVIVPLISGIIISIFVPYLVVHTVSIVKRSIPVVSRIAVYISEIIEQFELSFFNFQGLPEFFGKTITEATTFFARSGVMLAEEMGRIFFSLVIAFYMLCERKTIAGHLLLFVPLKWRSTLLYMLRSSKNAVLGYLSGLMKTSAYITGATFIGLQLIGIPDAFLLALFMGVFEILPYIGPVFAAIPVLLSAIPLGLDQTLLSIVLLVFVQIVEGNVISPLFTASSTSVHPMSALIGVFIFGSLFGISGVLLAVPVMIIAQNISWSIRQSSML